MVPGSAADKPPRTRQRGLVDRAVTTTVAPSGGQPLRDRASDPAAAAGDQSRFAG